MSQLSCGADHCRYSNSTKFLVLGFMECVSYVSKIPALEILVRLGDSRDCIHVKSKCNDLQCSTVRKGEHFRNPWLMY